MSLNDNFNRKVKKLTSKLVCTLTDFTEGSENHDSCMEFSLSNFYYHRYLAPESHKIKQQVEGLSEKFLIHSQPVKSEALERLFKIFLSKDLTGKIFANSAVHYSLVSILLNLSENPLNTIYSETIIFRSTPAKDDFDWTTHLLDGEDIPSYFPWDETPIGSDDDEEDIKNLKQPEHVMETLEDDLQNDNLQSDFNLMCSVDIVHSYWKKKTLSVNFTKVCTLSTPVLVKNSKVLLEEINVMREVLWLLCGHKNLFLFPVKGGKHTTAENIHLSHVTSESLQQSLNIFAKCGDVVSKLQHFIFTTGSHQSLTYEAFGASLLTFFNWMKKDILCIEKRLTAQEETILLTDLSEMLSHHIQTLFLIESIFACSVDIDKSDEKNALKTSRLLCVLYEAVLDQNNMMPYGESDELTSEDVIFNLWIDSIRPYIDIIDRWITLGILDDSKNEFVLQRIQTFADCKKSNFWNDAILPAIDNIDKVCPWLQTLFSTIITGGKSMEILQTLSALCRTNREEQLNLLLYQNSELKQSVYKHFLSRIASSKSKAASQAAVESDLSRSNFLNETDALIKANFHRLSAQPNAVSTTELLMDKRLKNKEPFPISVVKCLKPIIELKCCHANKHLLDVFKERFGLIEMLDVFHNFHLMGLGDVMHHFSSRLFEDLLNTDSLTSDLVGINNLMQEALSGQKLEQARIFVALKDTPNPHKKDGGLLIEQKSAGDIKMERHFSINATNCLELQCNVEWPVNLVLSEKCIAIYNQVFSYLLQIKRAVFCLESLKFSAIYKPKYRYFKPENESSSTSRTSRQVMSPFEKCHRMSMLRARLLHLLQHWHGFVMTSVIQAEKHIFSTRIAKATTLDDILIGHDLFLERICSLCLLDDKKQSCKLIQGTLKKIMILSIKFNMLWNHGIDNITHRSILKQEADFHEYSEFLGRILQTIANRGAVPILDSLAYAILL